MIQTEHAEVLLASDYAAYESLSKLSSAFGYKSQKTFTRVVEAIQKQKQRPVRIIAIGKRIKFNRYDISTLLA